MTDAEDPPEFKSFERVGEVEVRAKLETGEWVGLTAGFARRWLAGLDEARERARLEKAQLERAEELRLTERSTAAAERAAQASERAALASENSAKWTRAAAWGSAFAAIAAAVSAAWPLLSTVWSLPGAPK